MAGAVLLALGIACRQHEATDDRPVTAPLDGPIALHDGSNTVDLLGDGTPAQVLVAWRGNFNAHGFSVVAISVRARSDVDTIPEWQIVPLFGDARDRDAEHDLLTTEEGADCTLADIRLVAHRHAPAELIVAHRELGTSFADAAPTRFDYYALSRNANGVVGRPPVYFAFSRTVAAKRRYCDVNEAFDRELGLGSSGLGRAERTQ